MIRQACILVGGKGTRLGALTEATPKPLMELGGGVVFLDILIDALARQGFDDVVLLAGYLGHLIEDRYADRPGIRVMIEPQPLGTGGAISMARDLLAERFLLLNGDSFFDADLRAFATQAEGSEAAVLLREIDDPSRYGTAELDGTLIRRFREKSAEVAGPASINAGIYLLDRRILDRITALPCSIETDIFPVLAAEGRLTGLVREGYFLDIGLPETLAQGRRELLAFYRQGS